MYWDEEQRKKLSEWANNLTDGQLEVQTDPECQKNTDERAAAAHVRIRKMLQKAGHEVSMCENGLNFDKVDGVRLFVYIRHQQSECYSSYVTIRKLSCFLSENYRERNISREGTGSLNFKAIVKKIQEGISVGKARRKQEAEIETITRKSAALVESLNKKFNLRPFLSPIEASRYNESKVTVDYKIRDEDLTVEQADRLLTVLKELNLLR